MDTVKEVKRKKIICFDFDGVIHSYINGWAGIDLAIDLPVAGIPETIDKLRVSGKYKIVIYSSRCSQEAGIQCIKDYCAEYNIYYDEVTNIKPPAFLTIDDRCIAFNGVADDLFYKIENFTPWQKTSKKKPEIVYLPSGSNIIPNHKEVKKNLMLNYNKCDKCDEIKIDDLCDFIEFINGDELPICNYCILNMIENKEIIVDDGKYSFTKKGMEIIIGETEKKIEMLETYKLRYLNEIKELNK